MKHLIFSILVLLAVSVTAQDLISAKDAAKIINKPGVVVVDCTKTDQYAKVHVTNAINIWHQDLYKDGAVEGLIKSNDELAKFLGSKGIGNKSTVLLYDETDNRYSGRVYWIMKYLGAEDVKVIGGGITEWQKNRLPVTKNPHKLPAATFTPAPKKEIMAAMPQVKRGMNDPKTVLVDVRDKNEFKGTEGTTKRKGHIPGAVNLEFKSIQNEAGIIKPTAELEKMFTAAGITPDKEVILYCTTSVRAGIVYLALKTILNYPDVKVYDGAFNEWEANMSNPVQ